MYLPLWVLLLRPLVWITEFQHLVGFYAIECGNVLGLGGAFYAALCAVGILSKEERRTAEFLLAHPVSRVKIITEKLIAVLIQIIALNLIIYAISVGLQIYNQGGDSAKEEINLLHLAYYLLQIEFGGHLLWYLCISTQRKHWRGTWHCGDDVFYEPGRQHRRSCGVLEIHNTFRIL